MQAIFLYTTTPTAQVKRIFAHSTISYCDILALRRARSPREYTKVAQTLVP